MVTLSLAMIVKNEGDTIERVLGCAQSFCDEMIVVDTGSTDDTVIKAKAMGAVVYNFEWIDDFAAARNYSFSHCTKDWIIWLDGDDVVTPENQQRILALKDTVLNDELDGVYLRYMYPPILQWRERILRRDLFGKKIKWVEPIHECIEGLEEHKMKFFDDIYINHATPDDRHVLKEGRNINILRKNYKKGETSERTLLVYAVECLNNNNREETEAILSDFFATAQVSSYKYEIYNKMYHFYMRFGEEKIALEALSKAIAEDPKCADAYYKLGKHMLDIKDDPRAALPLLYAASYITLPTYGMPENMIYTYGTWEALSQAYFRLGEYAMAQEMAQKALEHNPPDANWLSQLAHYTSDDVPEALPADWQEWIEGNLGLQVPRANLMRVLEETRFTPAQIIMGMKIADQKLALN